MNDHQLIGQALAREAIRRGWCSEFETFLIELNHQLEQPLPYPKESSSTFKLWAPRIWADVWTKGWITQWYNAIAPLAKWESAGGKRTNLTVTEASALVDAYGRRDDAGARLTDDHTEQGRTWLQKYGAAKGLPDVDYRRAEFRFAGAVTYAGSGRGRATGAPRYLTILPDGSSFVYQASAWQTVHDNGIEWYWVKEALR